MKPILALATLTLVALALEEKTRQIAGEAHGAYGQIADQTRKSRDVVARKVKGSPIVSLLLAAGLGGALGVLLPRGR